MSVKKFSKEQSHIIVDHEFTVLIPMVYKTVTHCALLFPPRLISDSELGFERGLIGIKRESEHSSGPEIRSCSHETHIHYYHTKNTLSKNN